MKQKIVTPRTFGVKNEVSLGWFFLGLRFMDNGVGSVPDSSSTFVCVVTVNRINHVYTIHSISS